MSESNDKAAIERLSTVLKQDNSYVREDDRRVRHVRKSSLGSISEVGSTGSDVYIRADGKKVRRVKRGTKKTSDGVAGALPPKGPGLLPEPMFPGEPPQELLKAVRATANPLESVASPKYLVPHESKNVPPPRSTSAGTSTNVDPNLIPTALSNVAKALNNIEQLTSQGEGTNPWTSLPSFEESVKSLEQIQDEKEAALINPFEIFKKEEPRQVFLVPIEEPPPQHLPVPDECEDITSPPLSSEATLDAVSKIAAALATPQAPSPSKLRNTTVPPASDIHVLDDCITSPLSVASRGVDNNSMPIGSSYDDEYGSPSYDDEDPPPRRKFSPPKFRLPESFAAKTRSRADVDSFDGAESIGSYDRFSRGLHHMTDADAVVLNATFAHKRVKVVQLLLFGLLGILVGFLGSFFVQSTCHFINAEVVVGANAEVFVLHYGLWKYTPIDSAFQGYPYCTEYDDEYTADAPLISRIAGVASLVAGLYALLILWFYLIFGRASYKLWAWAVGLAGIACVCQGLTYLILIGDVCERNTCNFGPGAYVGIASTVAWFLLSFEMYYNMPTSAMMMHINPGGGGASVMSNLEYSDFARGASAYLRRISSGSGNVEPMPTLNEFQRRKDSSGSVGKGMMELHSIKMSASYKPPALD